MVGPCLQTAVCPQGPRKKTKPKHGMLWLPLGDPTWFSQGILWGPRQGIDTSQRGPAVRDALWISVIWGTKYRVGTSLSPKYKFSHLIAPLAKSNFDVHALGPEFPEMLSHGRETEMALVSLDYRSPRWDPKEFVPIDLHVHGARWWFCALVCKHLGSVALRPFGEYAVLCLCPPLPSPDSYSFLLECLLHRSCSGFFSLSISSLP